MRMAASWAAKEGWDECELVFATSGGEALQLMATEPFDVIVTDMRMPGMDGAQLLEEVSRIHPKTVRIVLSGQADQDSMFRAVRTTHQYLSKPCNAETLKSTVERVCKLQDSGTTLAETGWKKESLIA